MRLASVPHVGGLLVVPFLLTVSAAAVLADWSLEVVESHPSSGVGYHSSLALDSADIPHITYYDRAALPSGEGRGLRYATRTGAGWDIATVAVDPSSGTWESALLIDGSDIPHVGYLRPSAPWYAYWTVSGWVNEELTGMGSSALSPDLALNSGGTPYLVYASSGIWLADKSSGSWSRQRLDDGSHYYVGDPTLELDQNGLPHVAYWYQDEMYGPASLEYTYWDPVANRWISQTLTTGGYQASLALDASGHPHLSYLEPHPSSLCCDLKYAVWSGAAWQFQTVDGSGNVSAEASTSLALGADGVPHIAYYDASQGKMGALKFASSSGGSWLLETVTTDGAQQGGHYLAIDSGGFAHISFQNTTLDQMYTNNAPEPGTCGLAVILGLGAIGWLRRRRTGR